MSKRVRRSLKLEAIGKDKPAETPLKTNLQVYPFSPTTGACPLPTTVIKGNNVRQEAEQDTVAVPEKASRGQPLTDGNTDVMELFTEMEKSLGAFLSMRQKLKTLKTLEGSRELEILFGFREPSSDLKSEMQRAKFLIFELLALFFWLLPAFKLGSLTPSKNKMFFSEARKMKMLQ